MPDPIIAAVRRLADDAFDVLRATVDGLPVEALDWEPAGPDTNSIAVLTTHSLNATRLLVCRALGMPEPARDRDAEFTTAGDDAGTLRALIDRFSAEIGSLFDQAPDDNDWAAQRAFTRSDGTTTHNSAALYMVHAVDHLRGHADEAALTRHFWEARS
jgi:hypothetical protein